MWREKERARPVGKIMVMGGASINSLCAEIDGDETAATKTSVAKNEKQSARREDNLGEAEKS